MSEFEAQTSAHQFINFDVKSNIQEKGENGPCSPNFNPSANRFREKRFSQMITISQAAESQGGALPETFEQTTCGWGDILAVKIPVSTPWGFIFLINPRGQVSKWSKLCHQSNFLPLQLKSGTDQMLRDWNISPLLCLEIDVRISSYSFRVGSEKLGPCTFLMPPPQRAECWQGILHIRK